MRFCYYGHSFHERSQSTKFLLEFIRTVGEVEVCTVDPDAPNFCYDEIVRHALKRENDCHVFFQAEQLAQKLRPLISGRFIIFPMYDASRSQPDLFWQQFVNTRFVSFSRVHHEHLQSLECQSSYFCYFPELGSVSKYDFDNPSAFFWERRPDKVINQRLVVNLCEKIGLRSLHIHAAPDFSRHARPLSRSANMKVNGISVNRSVWFEDQQDYFEAARSHAVFFAPRPEEGIGMAFLEAMSRGQVVVAPDRPTMNEYIRHGTTGILFDPDAPDVALPTDAATLRRIGEAARRRIAFGREDWCADLERLKSILLDDGRRWSTGDSSSHFMNALLRSASSRVFDSAPSNGKSAKPLATRVAA